MGKTESDFEKSLRKARNAIDAATSSLADAEAMIDAARSGGRPPAWIDSDPFGAAVAMKRAALDLIGDFAGPDESMEAHRLRRAIESFSDACRPVHHVKPDMFVTIGQAQAKAEAAE